MKKEGLRKRKEVYKVRRQRKEMEKSSGWGRNKPMKRGGEYKKEEGRKVNQVGVYQCIFNLITGKSVQKRGKVTFSSFKII